jgi:predicted transcriptional regulator
MFYEKYGNIFTKIIFGFCFWKVSQFLFSMVEPVYKFFYYDENYFNILKRSILMTPLPVETSKLGDSVHNIINIMKDKNVGCVVISDESGHPAGIITERDIVRRLVFTNKGLENDTSIRNYVISSNICQ